MLMMAENSVNFKLLAIFIHILYLSSVFYIYFKSPILNGLDNVKLEVSAPAKRLILFVADGLQAEKAFHRKNVEQTRFLRHIITDVGRWGVSHTRVPTESRVGHVSLLAGTYEDVSAITNGWKVNPVEFDSLFNQSLKTWCWGSPDILNIFDKHEADNIESFSYSSKEIDFASSDPSKLDQWVFDHVTEFFETAKTDGKLFQQLQEKEIVFFLHLLGIDTNGHSKKPDSVEYLNNIALVDKGIQNITNLVNKFYKDDQTVFLVTSDHGMTPWGAHGTGLASETETPFIAWGAGIEEPVKKRNVNNDRQSMIWGLEDFLRTDVKQIDMTPFMSFLLGLSFPVNSVGVLPHQVLSADKRSKALGMLHNTKQIEKQYAAHEMKIKQSRFMFIPFVEFMNFGDPSLLVSEISKDIDEGKYQTAINKSEELIAIILKGIDYFHTYNRWSLSLSVNIAFVVWILLLVLKIMETQIFTNVLKGDRYVRKPWYMKILGSNIFALIYSILSVAVCIIFYLKSKDLSYVMYSMLPLLMVRLLLSKLDILYSFVSHLLEDFSQFYLAVLGYVVLVIVGIEVLVMAFFNRAALSILGVCLSIVPWFKLMVGKNQSNKFSITQKSVCVLFTFTSLLLSIFPQLPVIQHEQNYLLVVIAGFLIATTGIIYTFLVKAEDSMVIALQTVALVFCIVVKMHSVTSIEHGNGLPGANQAYSWSVLLLFPAFIFLTAGTSPARLFSVVLSLSGIYTLTSISYELFFLATLSINLISWTLLEVFVFSISSKNKKKYIQEKADLFTKDHIRIAFMFVYFIFMSFFGTGNIASINSFDISSTYCFQTVFNPWIQGVILATKVLVPFLMVTIMFRSMQSMTSIPMHSLFLMILLLTDLMSINFFFLVKDQGSWLDIGQSLSHFIITLAFVIFLVPVYGLSYFISGSVTFEIAKQHDM